MQDRLDELIVALRQHAQVMSAPDQAGEAGIEAFDALRRAAAAYGECVREQTHWDSPFAELEEDSSEELDAASEAEQDRDLLVVSGTWTFEVTDRDAWSRFAADQLESATPALWQLSGDPAEAASALLSYDGLSAWLGAHGVALLADDWTVRDTEEELPEDDLEE